MSKRIKVADLPEFDAAHSLDSETSIAAYLTDILQANDAALLASALGNIARTSHQMNETSTIVRHSLSQIKAMRERGEDQTSPEAPEAESLGADFWSSARVVMPAGKTSVHLRLDTDVVDWFKDAGKGHLTRMNAVLRAYVEAQKHSPSRS
jgi:probable addiction module antidote protein